MSGWAVAASGRRRMRSRREKARSLALEVK
jgi:hypothetical protein